MPNKNDKKQNQDNKDLFAKLDFEQPFKFKEEQLSILKEQFWKARGSSDGAPPPEPLNDPYRLDPFKAFIANLEPYINSSLLMLGELRKRPLKGKEKKMLNDLKKTSIILVNQLNELHPSTVFHLESASFYGYKREPLISEIKRLGQVLDEMLPPLTNQRGKPSSDWIFLVARIAGIMPNSGLNPTIRAGYLNYILEAVMDTIGLPDQSVETMIENAWPLIKKAAEQDELGLDL
jgi:hypothetical protein